MALHRIKRAVVVYVCKVNHNLIPYYVIFFLLLNLCLGYDVNRLEVGSVGYLPDKNVQFSHRLQGNGSLGRIKCFAVW